MRDDLYTHVCIRPTSAQQPLRCAALTNGRTKFRPIRPSYTMLVQQCTPGIPCSPREFSPTGGARPTQSAPRTSSQCPTTCVASIRGKPSSVKVVLGCCKKCGPSARSLSRSRLHSRQHAYDRTRGDSTTLRCTAEINAELRVTYRPVAANRGLRQQNIAGSPTFRHA